MAMVQPPIGIGAPQRLVVAIKPYAGRASLRSRGKASS